MEAASWNGPVEQVKMMERKGWITRERGEGGHGVSGSIRLTDLGLEVLKLH